MSDRYPESHHDTEVSPDNAELKQKEREGISIISKLSRGLSASLFVVVLCTAIIIGVFYFSATRIDAYAVEQSVKQVERLISIELGKLSDITLDFGWWNEAIEAMVYGQDVEWSDEFVGGYLLEQYGVDITLSFDRAGNLAYGRNRGIPLQNADADLIMTPKLAGMIQKAMKTNLDEKPKPVSGIIEVLGQPALAGVVAHTVYEPTDLELGVAHGHFVLIKMIDSKFLSAWSSNFQIPDLSYSPASPGDSRIDPAGAALGLWVGDDELIGHLQWSPDRAGDRFLGLVLPWAIPGGVLLILACIIFYSRLRHYRHVAIANHKELVANRDILFRQAKFDFLTGLVNRPVFLEIVERETSRCLRHRETAAIVYFDLDGFKAVNDTLGHESGDQLLRQVAKKLVANVRQEDTVARFGGDEFCLLVTDVHGPADIERVIEKIHTEFEEPINVGERELFIGASAGIVMIPDDTDDCSSMFRFADLAMYSAKAKGSNEYCFYSQVLEETSERRITLKSYLAKALSANELYLVYQPVYDLTDQSVRGLEALLRWNSPELGEVSPAEFIPVAEQSVLIDEIGLWVSEQALKDLPKFDEVLGHAIAVSINVSVKQLRDSQLPDKLDELLRRYGRQPHDLRLEITESLLISEYDNEQSVLTDLKARGYKLVLDDFGTGYSALGYLQNYPLETIKIDKSFIFEVTKSANTAALVTAIVNMAKTLGMSTVAEGIETEEQEEFVRSIGCCYGQGFLYSRPERCEKIVAFIRKQSEKMKTGTNFLS